MAHAGSRWKRRLAYVLAVALLVPLSVELLFRGWLHLNGTPYSTWKTEASMRQILAVLTYGITSAAAETAASAPSANGNDQRHLNSLDVLHPYFGIDFRGYLSDLQFENAYFQSAVARENYDVVVVGGSVAAGLAGASGNLLMAVLAEQPAFAGKTIRVHNQARGGFKQPQQVNVVTFLLSNGWHPDVIVNVDGFNEVALAVDNARSGANPLYPVFGEWAPFAARGTAALAAVEYRVRAEDRRRRIRGLYDAVVGPRLTVSAAIGSLALRRFQEALKDRDADADAYVRSFDNNTEDLGITGPPFDPDPAKVIDAAVCGWVEGSRSLDANCKARSIAYVHVLQPTFHDTGSKTPTQHELSRTMAPEAYLDGVHAGYPRLRQEGQRLRSEGVDFVDGSFLFKDVKDDIYVDNCHYNILGNRIVNEAIARALADQLRGAKR